MIECVGEPDAEIHHERLEVRRAAVAAVVPHHLLERALDGQKLAIFLVVDDFSTGQRRFVEIIEELFRTCVEPSNPGTR
jgi:hypothetical protein